MQGVAVGSTSIWRKLPAAILIIALARASGLWRPGQSLQPEPLRRTTLWTRLRPVAVAGLILAAGGLVAVFTAQALSISLTLPSDQIDRQHHLPFRLALLFLLCISCWPLLSGQLGATRRYWTSWWDPSPARPDGDIGWAEVLEMTIGGPDGDPLTEAAKFRWRFFCRFIVPQLFAVAAAAMVLATAVDRLMVWRLPTIIGGGGGVQEHQLAALTNASANLTAYLALLAAAVSIVFTYHQLRAKVRSDNRQVWIDRARRLLSRIIGDADDGANQSKGAVNRRIELELMLNPREKDHRLLIYLIQRLARVPERDRIEAGRHLRRVVADDLARSRRRNSEQLLAVLDEGDHGTLVSYVVRLSHVLLKREWERVKHTR